MKEDDGGGFVYALAGIVFVVLSVLLIASKPPDPVEKPIPAYKQVGTVEQVTFKPYEPDAWQSKPADHVVVVSTGAAKYVFDNQKDAAEAEALWRQVHVGSKVELTIQGDEVTARVLP